MGIEMKIIFLQNLTGGLFGGILKGLFTRTPTIAVLLLTAVIAACASSSDSNSSGPTTTTPPTTVTADCTFDEDVGTKDCGPITLPQIFDSPTTYNVTVGEVGEETTNKIGFSNFTFTQIINGSVSGTAGIISDTANIYSGLLRLSANVDTLNITITGIDDDVFGEFYIELVKSDDASVKVRYTISITSVNDAPVFVRGNSPGVGFADATDTTLAIYNFADIQFNSTAGYSVGNVSVRDIDSNNNTITYSISDEYSINGTPAGRNTLFEINSVTGLATGEITLKAIADADSVGDYTFNVTANDGKKGGITIAVINVRVLPNNQAPMFRAFPGSESQFIAVRSDTGLPRYNFDGVPINSAMGYSVGNVFATDANNDDITYSINNIYLINESTSDFVENTLFTINSATGEVTLSATAEAGDLGMYQVNATATDEQGVNATATISVYVDNSPPVFTTRSYGFNLLLSDASAGAVVGEVSAMDAERTPFGYSLVNNDNDDLFELVELANAKNPGGSINIILSRDADLSDFAAPSITFQVVATHQEGALPSEATITVNLINNLQPSDNFDTDGVKGLYDAFPHDATMNVTGNGEPGTPYIIRNIYQLQAIAGVDHTGMPLDSSTFTNNRFLYGTDAADQLTKHYELANDIDASATNTTIWRNTAVAAVGTDNFIGRGWTPIAGKSAQSFSGSFNGEGYAINSLEIIARQGDNSKHFGLFGINNGNITAVGLQNINMTIQAEGNNYLGTTTVDTIVDGSHAGGLVALNQEDGNITYSYTTGLANGSMDAMGGLVGLNQGKISYSYSTATVQGAGDTGGLLGTNQGGALLSSYATGDVRGSTGIFGRDGTAGGLAGSISGAGAIISTSYAAGSVSNQGGDAGASLGGVIGERNQTAGNGVTIESSYWDSTATPVLPGVGKNRDNITITGEEAGTTSFTTTLLQNCELGGMPTSETSCAPLFPSGDWGDSTVGDIERSWIFNADEYPSLSAVRSPDEQLLPSAAVQQCHREGNPLGICE